MSLHVQEWGNSHQPILILLHGFMGTQSDFDSLIPLLTSHFFCVSLDLPGHGSSKQVEFDSFTTYLNCIEKALSSYLERHPSLLGYSMGGRIAQHLATKHPLTSLILIAAKVFPLSSLEKKEREKKDLELIKKLEKESFSNFLTNWYSQPLFCTLESTLKIEVIQKRLKENPKLLAQVLRTLSPAVCPTSPWIGQNKKAPLLYLTGLEDQKYVREAQAVQKLFPDTWSVQLSDRSHALHLEDPHCIANHIQNFYRYYYDGMERRVSV